MGIFHAIDIAATGAGLGRVWLDTLAHNLSNLNTVREPDVEPFRAQLVWAQAREGRGGLDPGDGVAAVALLDSTAEPEWVYEPDHPLASDEGYVVRAVVDLAGQMSDLIIASRAYQMNLEVVRSSREAYEAALTIGRT